MIERTIWGPHICEECGGQVDFVYIEDQGDNDTGPYYVQLCPKCGGENTTVEAEPCTCADGWKTKYEVVCKDCKKRLRGDLERFFRGYKKDEREYLQDLLCEFSVEELV